MSKFLTPPVWYDKNGNLVEILTGEMWGEGNIYTDSMAIGKNSYVAGSYSTVVGDGASALGDNTIAIGSNAHSYEGGIAIGSNATITPGEGTIGSIAIGKGSHVYGDGSIAIGEGIKLGSATNPLNYTIQIGAPDQTYSAQIGNGNGILKCRASEVAPIAYKINKEVNEPGGHLSISYPDGFILKEHGIYGLVFAVVGEYQTVPMIFDSITPGTTFTRFNLSSGASNTKTIIYGSILWGSSAFTLHLDPLVTSDQTTIQVYLKYIVYLGSFQ